MANYNSVQEIIDAGITNMTCLRNNSAQDDGTDTLTGADWLTFNGAAVATIYASGNTWLGFGSSTEHLKVNRRDAKMWYLYREEGALYGYYNFIKIRWSGYSAYSYTVSTTQPDVTFYKQESGGYTVQNEIANIAVPFDRKYLIKNYTSDGYELLTVDAEGAFQTVPTLEITAETFKTYGFNSVPASDLLVTLSKFDVMLWYDSTEQLPALAAEIMATPPAQTVVTDLIDISDETILGIESITAVETGNPLFALSFDGKQTWEAWTGSAWTTLDSAISGMTKELLESIAIDQWAAKVTGLTGFHLKFILHDGDTVESIVVDFIN